MTATINGNYMQTTTAAGTFNVVSSGYIQGMFLPDPAVRYQLAGGVLANSETIPMWGGVGINETVNPNGLPNALVPANQLGGLITRATNLTSGAVGQLTGFTVFDQAYGMVAQAGSPVPLAASYMQVNFFRLGSRARIVVKAVPSLVSLETQSIRTPVSWDFVNQQLIPGIAAYATANVQSATYTSSTGIIALTFATAPLGAGVGSTANGVYLSISGLTASAGDPTQVNGDFPIVSTASAGTVINLQGPIGQGTITINGSTGVLAAGGGILNVSVIQMEIGNSMTVNYSPTTGLTSWNYQGTIAVIEI